MPVFEISSGNCIIKADNEEKARFAFANYVAGDLGIECFHVKKLNRSEYDKDDIDFEG